MRHFHSSGGRVTRSNASSNVTIQKAESDYTVRLAERGSPETTLRYYTAKWAALKAYIGATVPLSHITQETISKYITMRRDGGVCNKTIKAELALLDRAYRHAEMQRDWRVPVFRIEEHPRMAPPPAVVARLWKELQGPYRIALGLCLLTGMRASEALRATADDVDRDRATLRMSGRKTNDSHTVALCPTLVALIPQHGKLVAAEESAVRSAFVRASERAGIKPVWSGPGLGRHCFATYAVGYGGYYTEQVADALGHARPGIATLRYVHAQAIEPLLRPMSACVERVLLAALGD